MSSSNQPFRFAHFLFAIAMILGTSISTQAAIITRPILKEFFEKGDKPTQPQFSTLLDSMVNYSDDRMLLGLKTYDPTKQYLPGDTVVYSRSVAGEMVSTNPADYVDTRGLNHDVAFDFAGQFGFLQVKLGDSTGVYYGYLQIQMDPINPGGAGGSLLQTDAAINVQYLVFNDTPGQSLEITAVPEPTAAFAMIALLPGLRRKRSR